MKEFVEKLIERIEELKENSMNDMCLVFSAKENCEMEPSCASCHLEQVIKVIKGLEEEVAPDTNVGSNLQGNLTGWIPCSERFPGTDEYILLSFENFSIPVVGRYEEDEEGGEFYVGDEDESCVKHGLFVNAWMPLPEPYSVSTSQNLATEQKEIPVNHYIERFNRVI